jgi:ABC-type multidrug transport system ATPase subunit
VLLLDEPTANLDAESRRDFVALLANLGASRTVVFTSHRFDEVLALADRMLWLDGGRLVRDGRPETLAAQFEARIATRDFGPPPEPMSEVCHGAS